MSPERRVVADSNPDAQPKLPRTVSISTGGRGRGLSARTGSRRGERESRSNTFFREETNRLLGHVFRRWWDLDSLNINSHPRKKKPGEGSAGWRARTISPGPGLTRRPDEIVGRPVTGSRVEGACPSPVAKRADLKTQIPESANCLETRLLGPPQPDSPGEPGTGE